MPYFVSGTDVRGVNTVIRKTPELALRKARELIKRGCYDVRITTPEGPDLPFVRICGSSPDTCLRLSQKHLPTP